MKILAIDYGTVKTGLAIGDAEEKISAPYKLISSVDQEKCIDIIASLCKKENIELIVIGYEKRWHTSKTPYATSFKTFIKTLKQKTKLDIVKVDESLTTKIAKQCHPDSFGISKDALAASLILNAYLDRLEL
jgi:putative transcription antitermination factor YqgF